MYPAKQCLGWGFFAHQRINYYAVFLLPPEMLVLYKPNLAFITEHSVDPDKRRYAIEVEAPRHYIDMDRYGVNGYDSLPHQWEDAVRKYSEDTLLSHGIVPWWVQTMQRRLVTAFREKDRGRILKLSAELGHYIADAHVPLHASSNHNGQHTGQHGIHGFWESRIPELMADRHWDFFIGRAGYVKIPGEYIWNRVKESALAADTVLLYERQLSARFASDQKFSFEDRNGIINRQYSTAYSVSYDQMLRGMIERRMRLSIYAVASFWYSAWVDAGQPDLTTLMGSDFSEEDKQEFELLNHAWKTGHVKGRNEE